MSSSTPQITPSEALDTLMQGNWRFVDGRLKHEHQDAGRRKDLAQNGQHPFAIIFGCIDSRVPPEVVFDQGLGDLLVIRTAGNVLDNAALGSIEFGVDHLGIPLIMVLGHTACGAVKATVETMHTGHQAPNQIDMLVRSLRPAVESAHSLYGEPDLVNNAVKVHIERTAAALKTSPVLAQALVAGKLRVVGALYDLEIGKVEITLG